MRIDEKMEHQDGDLFVIYDSNECLGEDDEIKKSFLSKKFNGDSFVQRLQQLMQNHGFSQAAVEGIKNGEWGMQR